MLIKKIITDYYDNEMGMAVSKTQIIFFGIPIVTKLYLSSSVEAISAFMMTESADPVSLYHNINMGFKPNKDEDKSKITKQPNKSTETNWKR